jgi:hypothetical protein
MFEGALSNLLIVDSGNGEVYFVEDKSKKPKLDEVHKNEINEIEENIGVKKCFKRNKRRIRSESSEEDEADAGIK